MSGDGEEFDPFAESGGSLATATFAERVVRRHGGTDPNEAVDAAGLRADLLSKSQGASPDDSLRRRLAPHLGFDPTQARLHFNETAAQAARGLGAEAFTIGRDVFFNAGRFDPYTPQGLGLLAHELTHVGQQTGGMDGRLYTPEGGDEMEREAQAMEMDVVRNLVDPGPAVERVSLDFMNDSGGWETHAFTLVPAVIDRAAEILKARGSSIKLYSLEVDIEVDPDKESESEIVERWAQAIAKAAIARQSAVATHFGGDEIVQRKVGFEFEDNSWRSWVVEGPGIAVEQIGDHHDFVRAPGPMGQTVRAARRKEQLNAGTGYVLEADEMSAEMADIEFVTDPFEETAAGKAALTATLDEMVALHGRLAGLTGRGHGRYVWHGQHGMTNPDALLTLGDAGGHFKMQATQGLPLRDIATMMETFGINVPHETPVQTVARQGARAIMGAGIHQKVPSLIGAAPTLADTAIAHFQASKPIAFPVGGDFQDLRGFLSLFLLSLQMHAIPKTDYIKATIAFLARTDFARMFRLLPATQRRALRRGSARLLKDAVVAALGAEFSVDRSVIPKFRPADHPVLEGTSYLNPAGKTEYAYHSHSALNELKIGMYLEDFTKGQGAVDRLREDKMVEFLDQFYQSAAEPSADYRALSLQRNRIDAKYLVSVSDRGRLTDDTVDSDLRSVLIENRGINPDTHPLLSAADMKTEALAYMDIMIGIRQASTARRAMAAAPGPGVGAPGGPLLGPGAAAAAPMMRGLPGEPSPSSAREQAAEATQETVARGLMRQGVQFLRYVNPGQTVVAGPELAAVNAANNVRQQEAVFLQIEGLGDRYRAYVRALRIKAAKDPEMMKSLITWVPDLDVLDALQSDVKSIHHLKTFLDLTRDGMLVYTFLQGLDPVARDDSALTRDFKLVLAARDRLHVTPAALANVWRFLDQKQVFHTAAWHDSQFTPGERSVGAIQYLLRLQAANAANKDLEISQLIAMVASEEADHGHALHRHGAHLDDEQLKHRLFTGVAADNKHVPAPASTRFVNFDTMVRLKNAAMTMIGADAPTQGVIAAHRASPAYLAWMAGGRVGPMPQAPNIPPFVIECNVEPASGFLYKGAGTTRPAGEAGAFLQRVYGPGDVVAVDSATVKFAAKLYQSAGEFASVVANAMDAGRAFVEPRIIANDATTVQVDAQVAAMSVPAAGLLARQAQLAAMALELTQLETALNRFQHSADRVHRDALRYADATAAGNPGVPANAANAGLVAAGVARILLMPQGIAAGPGFNLLLTDTIRVGNALAAAAPAVVPAVVPPVPGAMIGSFQIAVAYEGNKPNGQPLLTPKQFYPDPIKRAPTHATHQVTL